MGVTQRAGRTADLRGGGPEELVLRFEDGDARQEVVDALLQHLHLLAHGEHQVALDEVHRLLDLVVDRHRAASRGAVKTKTNPRLSSTVRTHSPSAASRSALTCPEGK